MNTLISDLAVVAQRGRVPVLYCRPPPPPPGRSATLQTFPWKICKIKDLAQGEGLLHCRSSPFHWRSSPGKDLQHCCRPSPIFVKFRILIFRCIEKRVLIIIKDFTYTKFVKWWDEWYCKRDYFRWGKISRGGNSYFLHTGKWVLFSRGGNFREEDKSAKIAKLTPMRKFPRLQYADFVINRF